MSEPLHLRFQQLPTDERRELALTMLDVIAPYGSVDEAVVDPARFETWLIALNSAGNAGPTTVSTESMEVIDKFGEEPDGRGFYAFGAVVLAHYVAEVMLGEDEEAVINVAKRFLDLAGAADDDGEAGIYALATGFLVEPNVHKRTTSRRVRHHVATLLS